MAASADTRDICNLMMQLPVSANDAFQSKVGTSATDPIKRELYLRLANDDIRGVDAKHAA